eukprot:6624940-Prymnesium_polylepis.1
MHSLACLRAAQWCGSRPICAAGGRGGVGGGTHASGRCGGGSARGARRGQGAHGRAGVGLPGFSAAVRRSGCGARARGARV